MPAYSCVALLNAALVVGARPVLADVLPGRWTLDPDDAAARMTTRTRAVIAVNLFGMPGAAGRAALARRAGRRGLRARHRRATAAGPFGGGADVSIASFYATKMIAGGEGGMIASGDASLVERARAARDYGDQLPGAQNLNDKMTDVEAAIVREQLGSPAGDARAARRAGRVVRRAARAARGRRARGAASGRAGADLVPLRPATGRRLERGRGRPDGGARACAWSSRSGTCAPRSTGATALPAPPTPTSASSRCRCTRTSRRHEQEYVAERLIEVLA